MITFHLHGEIGKLFGEKWELNVKSVSEGMRAMFANTKGRMERYFRDHQREYFIVKDGDYEMDRKEELCGPVSSKIVHISPVIQGAGAAAKIILGVVLIIVGAMTSWGGGGMLIMTGIGLILGGITELLTPIPKFKKEETIQSYFFNNGVSTVKQGMPIPVGYGRQMILGLPISVQLKHEDIMSGAVVPTNLDPLRKKQICMNRGGCMVQYEQD